MNKKRPTLILLFISSLLFTIPTLGQTLTKSEEKLMGKKEDLKLNTTYELLPKVAKAFKRMQKAALKKGINIELVSAYRSYERQREIWNAKYTRYLNEGMTPKEAVTRIIEYSTIPGTSRHHWGTEIDIIDGYHRVEGDNLLSELFHDKGPFEKLRLWLDENAKQYGFVRVYTNDPNRTGFYYEPWHYSYTKISKEYLKRYQEIELYALFKNDELLMGKEALDSAFVEKYRKDYILGVDNDLKSFSN